MIDDAPLLGIRLKKLTESTNTLSESTADIAYKVARHNLTSSIQTYLETPTKKGERPTDIELNIIDAVANMLQYVGDNENDEDRAAILDAISQIKQSENKGSDEIAMRLCNLALIANDNNNAPIFTEDNNRKYLIKTHKDSFSEALRSNIDNPEKQQELKTKLYEDIFNSNIAIDDLRDTLRVVLDTSKTDDLAALLKVCNQRDFGRPGVIDRFKKAELAQATAASLLASIALDIDYKARELNDFNAAAVVPPVDLDIAFYWVKELNEHLSESDVQIIFNEEDQEKILNAASVMKTQMDHIVEYSAEIQNNFLDLHPALDAHENAGQS